MSDTKARLQRNTRLLYLNSFLENSFYIDAIYVLFGTSYLHLSFSKAGSLFFIGWFASIIFDFLGGIAADRYGRRQAQLYGLALEALSFVPFVFVRNYYVLATATFVWGVGVALTSNTLQALVYEQALEQGDTKAYQRLNALSQVWLFGGVAGAGLIGGAVYLLNPRLPYLLMVLTFAAAFVVCKQISVPQKVERALEEKVRSKDIFSTAIRTFRGNRTLLSFVVVSFFAGIVSDLLFLYYQPYYIKLHVTAFTLGAVFAAIRVVSGAGSYAMQKLPNHLSLPAIQMLAVIGIAGTALLMLILKLPIVLLAPLIMAFESGFNEPNMRLFVNRHAPNSARAAALSLGSGVMNLGVGIGAVLAFWMADTYASATVLKVVLAATAITITLSGFTVLAERKSVAESPSIA